MEHDIKAIIGLGNPEPRFGFNRHNIGFIVVDALAQKYGSSWRQTEQLAFSQITIDTKNILLVKPLTYMNSSGLITPWLNKKGIGAQNILVVHDELELPFGQVNVKAGGSARGHNGLKSLIQYLGTDFARIRCGIGRPEHKEDVANYVLSDFTEGDAAVDQMVECAIKECENFISAPLV